MIFDVSTKNIHFYRVLGLRENCLLSLQAALNERDLMSNKVKELIAENKTIKETQKNVQVLNIQLFFTQILPSLLLKKKKEKCWKWINYNVQCYVIISNFFLKLKPKKWMVVLH